jgi:hypothetical protein
LKSVFVSVFRAPLIYSILANVKIVKK